MNFTKASGNKILSSVAKNSAMNTKDIISIPIDQIVENADNDKVFNMDGIQGLADSIKEHGFMGAIEVYQLPDGKYEIVSGHRRFRAMSSLGEKSIPCIISRNDDAKTKAKKMLASNVFNREMSADDWNNAINYYIANITDDGVDNSKTRKECMEFFHINEARLSRYLSLSKLVPELRKFTKIKDFPSSALFPAAKLTEDDQKELANSIEGQVVKLRDTSEDGLVDYSAVGKNFIVMEITSIKNRNSNYHIDARLEKKEMPSAPDEPFIDNSDNDNEYTYSENNDELDSEYDSSEENVAPFVPQPEQKSRIKVPLADNMNRSNEVPRETVVANYLRDFLNKLEVLDIRNKEVDVILGMIRDKIGNILDN